MRIDPLELNFFLSILLMLSKLIILSYFLCSSAISKEPAPMETIALGSEVPEPDDTNLFRDVRFYWGVMISGVLEEDCWGDSVLIIMGSLD